MTNQKTNQTASEAYTTANVKCRVLLKDIEYYLKQHSAEFNKSNKKSWGYAGDLSHVETELTDILNFLRGEN